MFQPSPNFDSPRSPIQNPRLCLKVRNHHPVFSAHKTLLEFIYPPPPSRLSRSLVSLFELVVYRLALSYRIGPHATGATVLTTLDLDLTLTSAPSSHSRPTPSEIPCFTVELDIISVLDDKQTSYIPLHLGITPPIRRLSCCEIILSGPIEPLIDFASLHCLPVYCDRRHSSPSPLEFEYLQFHRSQWPTSAQATSLVTRSPSRLCPSPSSHG